MNKTFVPIERFGRYLGIPVKWLKAEVEAKRLPSLIVGRKILVPAIAEQALIEHTFRHPGEPLAAPLELGEWEWEDAPAPDHEPEGVSAR